MYVFSLIAPLSLSTSVGELFLFKGLGSLCCLYYEVEHFNITCPLRIILNGKFLFKVICINPNENENLSKLKKLTGLRRPSASCRFGFDTSIILLV